MIISINDIGLGDSNDVIASALSFNQIPVMSVNVDWTQNPSDICESIDQARQKMAERKMRFDGFAGTGLGAVIALLLAKPEVHRWLALDIPRQPKEYFEEAIGKYGIDVPADRKDDILSWYEKAEKGIIPRLKILKLFPPVGDSILVLSKEDPEFRNTLINMELDYSVIDANTQEEKLQRLSYMVF